MVYNFTSPVTCNTDSLGPSLADEFCSASLFVAFATLLNAFLRSKEEISGICERVHSVEVPDDVYDFVVIGGGAGGSVVASRLSENPDWKVLLLEAGPDESVAMQVPLLHETSFGSVLDWNYTLTNESYGCSTPDGNCPISAARMLGGSTADSMMLYTRGNPSDYDRWAASGNEDWSYEDVLPYFKKGEDNGEIDRVGSEYHGTGGPLSVERVPYLHPFGYSVLQASIETGYGVSEDLNGENITGFSFMQTTTKNGVRRSSAAAYLRPARNRTNLHISLDSTATRVTVENGSAVGVEYYKNGRFRTVKVRKEVIVAAGTIGSPKLLLLSGIGPKEHLESVGVPLVHDSPGIGNNFHDQVSFYVPFTINEPNTYHYDWAAAAEYLAFQTGRLSAIGLESVMGKLATNLTTPNDPDLRVVFSYNIGCSSGEIDGLRNSGPRFVWLLVANQQTKSRGRVTLASNDPLANPVVWANHLGDPSDVDRIVQGIELGLAMTKTQAMRANDIALYEYSATVPACYNHTFASSEYWACAVRQVAGPESQQAGTCKMGPSTDPMAVVDSRLRLRGIKGIRLADASVMPQMVSGLMEAPEMMIGERAADFIKSDWK